MMHRGRVTAVDAKGVYVRAGSLGQGVFLCGLVGARPAVGASVLVADTGDPGCPDLTVIGGGLNADGSLTVGGLTIGYDGGGWVRFDAPSNNIALKAGTTELRVNYSGTVSTNRLSVKADSAYALVTKGYVDAIKSALAASTDFADFKARVAAL